MFCDCGSSLTSPILGYVYLHYISQQTHNVPITLFRRRSDVMTSLRRRNDVITDTVYIRLNIFTCTSFDQSSINDMKIRCVSVISLITNKRLGTTKPGILPIEDR